MDGYNLLEDILPLFHSVRSNIRPQTVTNTQNINQSRLIFFMQHPFKTHTLWTPWLSINCSYFCAMCLSFSYDTDGNYSKSHKSGTNVQICHLAIVTSLHALVSASLLHSILDVCEAVSCQKQHRWRQRRANRWTKLVNTEKKNSERRQITDGQTKFLSVWPFLTNCNQFASWSRWSNLNSSGKITRRWSHVKFEFHTLALFTLGLER